MARLDGVEDEEKAEANGSVLFCVLRRRVDASVVLTEGFVAADEDGRNFARVLEEGVLVGRRLALGFPSSALPLPFPCSTSSHLRSPLAFSHISLASSRTSSSLTSASSLGSANLSRTAASSSLARLSAFFVSRKVFRSVRESA